MKNIKSNIARLAVLSLTIIFLVTAVSFEIFELSSLPAQFFGTLLGVVITAIITVLLLQGQTKSEESREIHLKVFEKKQDVYFHFLTKLNRLLQQEKIDLHLSNQKSLEQEVGNLQDLLFEFGFLKMHTSAATFDRTVERVEHLLRANRILKSLNTKTESDFEIYYQALSRDFFEIVNDLKIELYKTEACPAHAEQFDRIIQLSL